MGIQAFKSRSWARRNQFLQIRARNETEINMISKIDWKSGENHCLGRIDSVAHSTGASSPNSVRDPKPIPQKASSTQERIPTSVFKFSGEPFPLLRADRPRRNLMRIPSKEMKARNISIHMKIRSQFISPSGRNTQIPPKTAK